MDSVSKIFFFIWNLKEITSYTNTYMHRSSYEIHVEENYFLKTDSSQHIRLHLRIVAVFTTQTTVPNSYVP